MFTKISIFTLVIIVAIQFIPMDKTNPPVNKTLALQTSPEVMEVLKKSCYDCHSYETKWPYYSDIAPVSFFVSSHVKKARKALNFSIWEEIDPKIKEQRLKRAVITVNNEMMALPSYVLAHEEAKLSKDEKALLINWFKSEMKE